SLSTTLTYVAASAGPTGTGPAQVAPTPLTGEQAQAFAIKAAEPFLNLPGLRIQAAATEGIAKAETLLTEYLNTSNDIDVDGGGGADEDEEEVEEDIDGPGKKTGFSAQDVKQFRAAAVSAAANQVPLLTLQDGNECSDLCIAGRGELPDAAESETDAEDTEDEGDDIEGGGAEEGDDKPGNDEDGLISRLWKRVVSPPAKAGAETETDDDDDDDSDNPDAAPANAADSAAAIVDKKINMSEDEFLSKIESCVQS
ncbi:hypothetical protein BGX30_008156, partial [Mortierella sp. GBA39]